MMLSMATWARAWPAHGLRQKNPPVIRCPIQAHLRTIHGSLAPANWRRQDGQAASGAEPGKPGQAAVEKVHKSVWRKVVAKRLKNHEVPRLALSHLPKRKLGEGHGPTSSDGGLKETLCDGHLGVIRNSNRVPGEMAGWPATQRPRSCVAQDACHGTN